MNSIRLRRQPLGAALNQLGRYDEAIADFERAMLVSPNHPYYCGLLTKHAQALLMTGRFEEVVEVADRAISGPNRAFYARATRAAALTRLGRSREAAEMVRQLKEHAPEFSLETVRRGMSSFQDLEKLLVLFEQAGIPPLPDADTAPGGNKT